MWSTEDRDTSLMDIMSDQGINIDHSGKAVKTIPSCVTPIAGRLLSVSVPVVPGRSRDHKTIPTPAHETAWWTHTINSRTVPLIDRPNNKKLIPRNISNARRSRG